MSKQLAISACASIFAMAAFALFTPAPPAQSPASAWNAQGATTEAAAPSFDRAIPVLFDLAR